MRHEAKLRRYHWGQMMSLVICFEDSSLDCLQLISCSSHRFFWISLYHDHTLQYGTVDGDIGIVEDIHWFVNQSSWASCSIINDLHFEICTGTNVMILCSSKNLTKEVMMEVYRYTHGYEKPSWWPILLFWVYLFAILEGVIVVVVMIDTYMNAEILGPTFLISFGKNLYIVQVDRKCRF